MSIPKIQLHGITKRFGKKQLLNGIDLDIMPGESLVVIGGSGSGKSVLIKSILGLITPDEGTIKIDGQDVTHLSERKREKHVMRKFGMLFQGGALFDSMKVWENVAFGLISVHGKSPRDAK
ncbi:MAG TPA: ABC transporter ATP-binding protein, partial [Rhodospirillaceae bacterium]|nr:ABC transporter ATP-binding protein [Rhodospirillaceae bacterium]